MWLIFLTMKNGFLICKWQWAFYSVAAGWGGPRELINSAHSNSLLRVNRRRNFDLWLGGLWLNANLIIFLAPAPQRQSYANNRTLFLRLYNLHTQSTRWNFFSSDCESFVEKLNFWFVSPRWNNSLLKKTIKWPAIKLLAAWAGAIDWRRNTQEKHRRGCRKPVVLTRDISRSPSSPWRAQTFSIMLAHSHAIFIYGMAIHHRWNSQAVALGSASANSLNASRQPRTTKKVYIGMRKYVERKRIRKKCVILPHST